MATSYTSLLGLALPVTGELSGTWGDTVNNSITSLLDTAVAGTTTVSADTTLTTTSGAANQARSAIIIASGHVANITITAPAQSKIYTVINASGTYTVTFRGVGPTTGVTLGVNEKAQLAWNGSDFVRIGGSGGAGVFSSITNTSLTSGRVVYSTTGGLETDSANLTFNGTTLTANTLSLTTALSTANGGTGLSSFTAGDLTYYASGTALTKLGIGTAGQILTSSGTAPQWSTLSGVAVTTFSAGTTGFTPSTATSGAITLAGTLATTNGGTGLTSFTANGVVYASSSSALTTGSALTFDGTNLATTGAMYAGNGLWVTGGSGTTRRLNFDASGVYYNWIDNDTGLMRFAIQNAEQMRLTSTGLGIGTSSPAQKLDVTGKIQSLVAGGGTHLLMGNSYATVSIGSAQNAGLDADLLFYTQTSTERMRLDSSGNLGLGVTPSAWGSGSKALEIGASGYVAFNGSSGSPFGYLAWNSYFDGSDYRYKFTGPSILAGSTTAGDFVWYQGASGTAGNVISYSQRMTLDSSGNLLVGRTSRLNNGRIEVLAATSEQAVVAQVVSNGNSLFQGFNAAGTAVFQVTGNAGLLLTSLGTGIVYSNAGNLTSTNPSDLRLKEDVQDLGWGLAQINALRPVSYAWKNNPINQGTQYGFIAQEVQSVMPELVREFETEEGIMLGLEKEGIYAAMVKAIQELKASNDALTARITQLESK